MSGLEFVPRRRLPAAFVRRVVEIGPGGSRPFDDAEWADALVVVESGELEVEGRCGGRFRFVDDDVLWLEGLPLAALHNPGGQPTVLVAVARALEPVTDDSGPGRRSNQA